MMTVLEANTHASGQLVQATIAQALAPGARSLRPAPAADLRDLRIAELTAANQALEAFAYSVAHDLRAPLRIIGFYSGMLLDGSVEGDLPRHYVRRIVEANERMTDMFSALLDLARVARGTLQAMWIDLSRMARDIAGELDAQSAGRSIEWRIDPDMRVHADPGMMRVVLENLIGNAWKFTRETQAAVIEIGREGEEFFVRDNGCGFEPEDGKLLFEPFRRLHGSTRFEGSGIGLSTVRRILERHGGGVRAEGEVDRGARFGFWLAAA